MQHRRLLSGMRGFLALSAGQCLSILGTSMTRFALTIWAWQATGSATSLALVGIFTWGPEILLSPIAGALVDRWNRKLTMMFSDMAAGVTTIITLVLHATGHLQIWHLCALGVFTGCFSSFQFPAFSAGVTLMVPKEQYARASGITSFVDSAALILAPLLAAMLLPFIGANGIMVIDLVSLAMAVGILFFILIPPAPPHPDADGTRGSFLSDCLFGFKYILARPSLLGLQLTFFGLNLSSSFGMTVMTPMILSRSGDNSILLGQVQSIGAIGSLVGALLLGVWGGPKRKVYGVLGGLLAGDLIGYLLLGFGRGFWLWAAGMFVFEFFMPMLNGSNQAIWQSKIPPALQGRVFAVRRLIAQVSGPLAMALAGPLADHYFEPALMGGGMPARVFGPLVGTGRGSGMALMIILAGLLGGAWAICAYLIPAIRNVEEIIPDHDYEMPGSTCAEGSVAG